MTKKKRGAQPEADAFPRKSVMVNKGGNAHEDAQNMAVVLTSPELAAYRVINGAEHKSGLGPHLDVPCLMAQLRDQAAEVNSGSLARPEAMLMNQATALQSMFARLAERAMGCNEVVPFEMNMRMALRAQAQCRATLETLATIKNPSPVAFVRQANIGNAVQVNNGVPPPSRAREHETAPNKLLESDNGERLDTRTTSTPSRADPQLATVGPIDGPANPGGQG